MVVTFSVTLMDYLFDLVLSPVGLDVRDSRATSESGSEISHRQWLS